MVYGELPAYTPFADEQAGIEGFREISPARWPAPDNADGVLVLCDMQSGTPWNIACQHAFSSQTIPPVAVVAGVNFPMLLQTDEVHHLTDVHDAAAQLLALTVPTLVMAAPTISVQSDDF
jgi:PTS system mannose-specific IIA component